MLLAGVVLATAGMGTAMAATPSNQVSVNAYNGPTVVQVIQTAHEFGMHAYKNPALKSVFQQQLGLLENNVKFSICGLSKIGQKNLINSMNAQFDSAMNHGTWKRY